MRTPLAEKVELTAIVASHDEARLLERCLPALAFCDELLVIDIASSDDTAAVAAAHGARVLRHEWVPIAERARMSLVGEARHEWLLMLDPDELLSPALAARIEALLPTLPDDVGLVRCPWRFFFRGSPLRGTIWGGIGTKGVLVHRERVELRPTVHSGTVLRAGFRSVDIPFSGDDAIEHHWAPTWRSLLEKHIRYIRLEGPDRHRNGLVTGYRDIVATPLAAFLESFWRRHGYRDGLAGLNLSLFWAAYSTAAKIALLRELRRAGAGADGP